MNKILYVMLFALLTGCHNPTAQVLEPRVPLVTNVQPEAQKNELTERRESCAWKILPEMSAEQIAEQASLIRDECRFTEQEFAQLLNDVFGAEDER